MERALEELVWQRAHGRCEYCHLPQDCSSQPHQIDHIRAQQHGGPTVAGNLALARFACNNHKGPNLAGWDPRMRKVVPLFHPRRHSWPHHFQWDGPVLVGRTAVGRATVATLAINLDYRVALRQALIDEGRFPPDD
jgi:hypothetical protein